MTDSSTVTKLDHDNGGTVNMQYNPEYQQLDVGKYSGQKGIFRMKTDLDSETNGDKVYMTGAAAGSQGLVQVHDKSFLLGKESPGRNICCSLQIIAGRPPSAVSLLMRAACGM